MFNHAHKDITLKRLMRFACILIIIIRVIYRFLERHKSLGYRDRYLHLLKMCNVTGYWGKSAFSPQYLEKY